MAKDSNTGGIVLALMISGSMFWAAMSFNGIMRLVMIVLAIAVGVGIIKQVQSM